LYTVLVARNHFVLALLLCTQFLLPETTLYLLNFFAHSSCCRKPFCISSASLHRVLVVGNNFVLALLLCTQLLSEIILYLFYFFAHSSFVGSHFARVLFVGAQFLLQLLQETKLLNFADHCSLEFLYESDVPWDSVFTNLQETRLIWIENLLIKMQCMGLSCFIIRHSLPKVKASKRRPTGNDF
jgi:hypothetical protein